MHDKKDYVIQIRNLIEALNPGLVFKKFIESTAQKMKFSIKDFFIFCAVVIKFKQEAWLEPYIDMNTEPRKNAKNDFKKYFFKLMNNAISQKTTENLRKHGDIKHVTTEARRNYLVS